MYLSQEATKWLMLYGISGPGESEHDAQNESPKAHWESTLEINIIRDMDPHHDRSNEGSGCQNTPLAPSALLRHFASCRCEDSRALASTGACVGLQAL
jgi:hypothetical protein